MSSKRAISRIIAAAVVGLGFSAAAAPAQADSLPIEWNVDATTHLASLNKDVHVPTGTFSGSYDFATGKVSGNLKLPQATSRLDLGSLPLANVTMAMEQTAPISGDIDIMTMQARTTSTFNVRILAIRPVLLPFFNLVNGSTCKTQTPVVASLAGKVDLAAGSTFTGSYDLPKFANCGFGVNQIINLLVPGPGNTMTAKFTPRA